MYAIFATLSPLPGRVRNPLLGGGTRIIEYTRIPPPVIRRQKGSAPAPRPAIQLNKSVQALAEQQNMPKVHAHLHWQ